MIVVDKPDSVQTEIRVGQLAIPRKHPDYLAWDLAVKILGGEGANRLHRVLRSERGLTYGASADTQAMKQAGDFVAETDTRTETTGEVLRLMVDEFSKLQRQRVGRARAGRRAGLSGRQLSADRRDAQRARDADPERRVLRAAGRARSARSASACRRSRPTTSSAVAQQYIRPDRLSIVLVGNAKAFVPQLRAPGFTDFEVIPIEQLDLMSATLRRDGRDGQRRAACSAGRPPLGYSRPRCRTRKRR